MLLAKGGLCASRESDVKALEAMLALRNSNTASAQGAKRIAMKTINSRLVLLTSLLASLSFTTFTATAQSLCDPALQQEAEAKAQKAMVEEMKRVEQTYGAHLKQPDWLAKSDGLLTACYKANWPKYSGSAPLLGKLYSQASERMTKEACDRARKMIADGASDYQSILKNVDGYQSLTSGSNFGGWTQVGDDLSGLPTGGGIDWGSLGGSLPGSGISLPGISNPGGTSGGSTGGKPSTGGGSGVPGITP